MKPPGQRIIHVPRRFAPAEWGGTESVVYHLCREQRASGWRPEIHTSRALDPVPQEIWRDIPVRRYRHCYPFFGLSREDVHALDKKGGNLVSLGLLWALCRMNDVRVFHAHVLKRMGGSVLVAARRRKRPFVVTLHGNVFDVPPEEAVSVVAAQAGHFEWGKPLGALLRSRRVLEEADAVVCVGWSEYLKAKETLGADRVYHLPNGVRPEVFAGGQGTTVRAALGIGPEAFVFGCVSRLDPQKNQLLLVEALALLKSRGRDAHVIVAGPVTNAAYRDKIQTAVRAAGLEGRFHLLPPVEAESSAHCDLLAALDVFVLPSRHEPFGIVVLEAWSAGVPVVASRVGGLTRLVDDGVTGLHFASGDAGELAGHLAYLADQPDVRASLVETARAIVRARYSWSAVADQQEQIYCAAEEHSTHRVS